MWQICYTIAGDPALHFDTVASEAEMLTMVRDRNHSADFSINHVTGPRGRQLSAAQVGFFLMLLDSKSRAPAPADGRPH